jgi:hypothetical protein
MRRHIAEGTDHLLFLLTLLLPAPLLVSGGHWGPPVDLRQSLLRILGIVTASCPSIWVLETTQMIVVVAVLPSLMLMSRTRAYPVLRIGGAVFAGMASLGGSFSGSSTFRLLSIPS